MLEERLRKRLDGRIEMAVPAVLLADLATRAAANFSTEVPVEVDVSLEQSAIAIDRLCAGEIQVAGS